MSELLTNVDGGTWELHYKCSHTKKHKDPHACEFCSYLPGSPVAIAMGCTCPAELNNHGAEAPATEWIEEYKSSFGWWLSTNCKVHRGYTRATKCDCAECAFKQNKDALEYISRRLA